MNILVRLLKVTITRPITLFIRVIIMMIVVMLMIFISPKAGKEPYKGESAGAHALLRRSFRVPGLGFGIFGVYSYDYYYCEYVY